MTAFTMSDLTGRMIQIPTRAEVKAMLARPSVMITLIICATFAFLVTFGGLIYLVSSGRQVEVVAVVLIAPMFGLLTLILKRLKTQTEHVKALADKETA